MSPTDSVPAFRPDFAARVLARADAIARRRHRLQRTGLAAAVILAAVFAGVARSPRGERPVPHEMPPATVEVASRTIQTQELDTLFPDADPLVRFDRNYSAAMSGIRVDDRTTSQDYIDAEYGWY